MKLLALFLFLLLAGRCRADPWVFVPTTQQPSLDGITAWNSTVNYCVDFVPNSSVTNATTALWGQAGSSITTVSISFYDATGATQLATTGGVSGAVPPNVHVATLSASLTLTAGTQYRMCWCSSTSGGAYASFGTGVFPSSPNGLANARVVNVGSAANPCLAGVPPATTGALTAVASGIQPAVIEVMVTTDTSTTTSTTTSTSIATTTSTSSSTTTVTTTTGTTSTTTGSFHVTDDFERASLGANWNANIPAFGGTNCIIVGSSDLSCSAADASCNCFWNANTPTTPQYACGQLSGQGLGESGVCVGYDTAGNGVCCAAWDDGLGGQYWTLNSYITGAEFPGIDGGTSPHFVTGDFIGIERLSATSFRCFRSTNGTTWTALGSGGPSTITGIPDPNKWGAQLNNDGGPNTPFMLEVWEGGNGTLPTGRVCGTP